MGKSSKTNQTTTTTSTPWSGIQPYLVGDKGIYPESARLYSEYGQPPKDQQDLATGYGKTVAERMPSLQNLSDISGGVISGGYATNRGDVGMIDANQMRYNMGATDPTKAVQQQLSGQLNPYTDQQAKAITDTLTRNTMQNVMPQLRSGAQSAGQYGGSRHGIAEGLAMSQLNTDTANALSNLYSQASQDAMNRQANMANNISNQALQLAQGNQNAQFQNADLNIRQNQANLANLLSGASLSSQASNLQDQAFNQQMELMNYPYNYQLNKLKDYVNVIQPSASQFQSTNQTVPLYKNAVGGAMAGATLGSMIGGVPGAIGGGLLGYIL